MTTHRHHRFGARVWVLLGATLLLAGSGLWAHRCLRREAERAEAPYAGVARAYGKGGPVAVRQALEQTGSPPEQAESVARALARRMKGGSSGSFVVVTSTAGDFHYVAAFRGRRAVIVGRHARGVEAPPVSEKLVRVSGKVRGPVNSSLERAGLPRELVEAYLDVFRWSLDLTADAKEGDSFVAAWTERSCAGRVIGRRLEGAGYGRTAGLRFDGDFLDAKGRSLRRAFLRAPMRYHSISSDYGRLRFKTRLWPLRVHHGTDFAAPMGTPVFCVADGVVERKGWLGEYGYLVSIRHAAGLETYYGHLSRYGSGLRRGAKVRQGSLLGHVGTSGNATGPHLHFELRRDGKAEDFRTAKLPNDRPARTKRPMAFKARWKEVFGG